MDLCLSNSCAGCGAKYIDEQLWFVDGDWFCRECLWDRFYTFLGGSLYCVSRWDSFTERYPDGLDQLIHLFRQEQTTGEDHIEEFVSENLEDYCDWISDFSNNERLVKATFEQIRRLCSGQVN